VVFGFTLVMIISRNLFLIPSDWDGSFNNVCHQE
jgi:hypothetical protein